MNSVSLVDGHIDEPRLTDEEIKKIFDMCSSDDVVCDNNCPLIDEKNCTTCIAKHALDLNNRQKAEIERLNVELVGMRGACESYKIHYDNAQAEIENLDRANLQLMAILQTAQSEARKEFAERVKARFAKLEFRDDNPHMKQKGEGILHEVIPIEVDNLLKEMDGESE